MTDGTDQHQKHPLEPVMDVGVELARARERRALSLNDLSRRTKISVASLMAIERGDVKQLPGGIFTRGFVRAYAREVGCDPEAIVERFLSAHEDTRPDPIPARQGQATDPPVCQSGQVHVSEIDSRDKRQSRAALIGIAVVVAIAGLGYLGLKARDWRTPASGSIAGPSVPSPADASTTAGLEVGTTGSRESRGDIAPQPAAADGVRLDIEPDGVCWVAATADGRQVVYRLLAPGERTRIEAREAVVLRVGDAGRFRFAVNGQPGRSLGAAGQVLTVVITPENYRDFLAR